MFANVLRAAVADRLALNSDWLTAQDYVDEEAACQKVKFIIICGLQLFLFPLLLAPGCML